MSYFGQMLYWTGAIEHVSNSAMDLYSNVSEEADPTGGRRPVAPQGIAAPVDAPHARRAVSCTALSLPLNSGCLGVVNIALGVHLRYLHRAKDKLTKKRGRWWSGNGAMKDSQMYTFTFASAVPRQASGIWHQGSRACKI